MLSVYTFPYVLILCSWNIAGLKDKLKKSEILNFLLESDIVWISETKKCFNVSVPGFRVYYNMSKSGAHRGGIMVLIKDSLLEYVKCIDMDTEGQIWITLTFLVTFKLGGVYIPPDDSPYFQQADIGALAAHTLQSGNLFVLGDLNARVAVPKLSDSDNRPFVYSGVVDHVLNARGRTLINMCSDNNMVIANHLVFNDKQLGGQLSFKRRNQWISELDLCLANQECCKLITQVATRQDIVGSDHAPLCVSIAIPSTLITNVEMLLERAVLLGHTHHQPKVMTTLKKTPSYRNTDLNQLTRILQEMPPPTITTHDQLPNVVESGCCTIMDVAARCIKTDVGSVHTPWDQTRPRWARILETRDPKYIWKSLNWKGSFDNREETQPSENIFKDHFERLLNQDDTTLTNSNIEIETAPYIPVLDDPFMVNEVDIAMNSLNQNKSYSGICPGILKVLPVSWFMFLMSIFNQVFTQCHYPLKWCFNKLFVLFKSGDRLSCDNYRGISIMDTLAKIYDTLIMNRLVLWFHIDKCQAGAQKGRSCLEQIFTLRLLINYVIHRKVKLYTLFIDYSKAYDRVSRRKLIEVLRSRGCGKVMLKAIQAMYSCTKNILKSAIIHASIGVRQGAPSSCLLFVIYIDEMIKMIKNAVEEDGFLGGLHALLLMDDTVIIATSREMCEAKLRVVLQYCQEFGMSVNVK